MKPGRAKPRGDTIEASHRDAQSSRSRHRCQVGDPSARLACCLNPGDFVPCDNERGKFEQLFALRSRQIESVCEGTRTSAIRKIAPNENLHESSTAPDLVGDERTFTITHPFHPLRGCRLALVTHRKNWGEDRVYFHDDEGRLRAIAASWTNFSLQDPFCKVAAGRCAFRFVDLRELVVLLRQIAHRADTASEKLQE